MASRSTARSSGLRSAATAVGQPALAPLAVLAQRDVAGLGQLDHRAPAVVGVGPAGDKAV